jgi:3'(2'), 5'-bisphosphate nucleotidase
LSANCDLDELDRLARLFGVIAVRAGEVIMNARAKMGLPDQKADGSPVTAADHEADEMIRACLKRNLPHLPVITEEHYAASPSINAERFILVDPLDGTKEFIRGKPEFTVNIALIDRGSPVAGAVCAPALHQLYIGGTNAYQLETKSGACGLSPEQSAWSALTSRRRRGGSGAERGGTPGRMP